MSNPDKDELSPEDAELFEHYRNGSIGPDEEVQLFELLNKLKHERGKTFKLRPMVEQLGYAAFDYKKLSSEWFRWQKRQQRQGPDIEPKGASPTAMSEKAQEISKGATKTLFDQIQEIGTLLVTQFSQNAANRGESLKDYVIKSIELREQYGDQIETLSQENDVLKVLCSMFAEALKPQFRQLAAVRMYLDWTTGLIQLQALGIDLNQQYIDEVTNRIETAMKTRVA